MIKLGNSGILLKVGSQDVQSAYLGSTLVYSASTTTTSTTTTTTSTTSTTTTTANPIPSGAYAIYDFGNVTSYPGSGSTVFDISGNSNNGTLINSPTFSSTFGGELRLDNASSQRIDYSATFTANTSTVIIWKNVDTTFSKDTGVPNLRGNNGYLAAFLGGTKQLTPILFNTTGGGATFFGASVSASDITQWHQWAQVVTYSSPNTTATTYLDGNASSATETSNFNRSGDGTGTANIGFDNAVGDRYANGFIMAYLHYNRALTTSELNSIYTYYSARFGGGTTTTTAAPTTTTTTTAAPTTTTTTLANACYDQTTVTFTSNDNVNFRFGYTSCDGTQSTLGGSTATPGSFTFNSSYCIRAGQVVAAPLGEGTVVTGVSQTSQCGTFTTTTTTTTAAPTTTTTSTTTTAAPTTTTTTLAAGIYNFYESVACCDTGSTSYLAIESGSTWYNNAFVIGLTYYNPTTDRCETINVSSSAVTPSFTITAVNQDTYVYGSTNTSSEQCNRCAILGAHICSGSICYNWSFQNTNVSTARNVYIVNCSGSAQTISVPAASTVTTCSYATPIAEVPAQTVITNLGVCGGTTTTTTTAAPTTTTTTLNPLQYWIVEPCGGSTQTSLAIDTGVTLTAGQAIRPTIAPLNSTRLPGYENGCWELISTTSSGTYCGILAPAASCAQSVCNTTTTTAAP
jgi:hypothetical protein